MGAMTTGVGVLGGMLLAGAATAGGDKGPGGADTKEKHLTLGCDKLIDADKWVQAIQGEIVKLGGSKDLVSSDYWSGDSGPPLEMRLEEVEGWIRSTRWRVHRLMHGIRVFEQNMHADSDSFDSFGGKVAVSVAAEKAPCLRINLSMNASPTHVFNTIMSMPPACRTGTVKSFGLVETLTSFVDIVHLALDPVYISPTWTAPRDLCLIRYWKQNSDGSYVVCLDSTTHGDCPLLPGYVRGELHAAYIISAPKFVPGLDGEGEDATECLLSCITQVFYVLCFVISDTHYCAVLLTVQPARLGVAVRRVSPRADGAVPDAHHRRAGRDRQRPIHAGELHATVGPSFTITILTYIYLL